MAAAFPKQDILDLLRVRIAARVIGATSLNDALSLTQAESVSSDNVGFTPSPLYLLSMVVENLPEGDARFGEARQMVMSALTGIVRERRSSAPFDRARMLEAILPTVVSEAQSANKPVALSAAIEGSNEKIPFKVLPGGAIARYRVNQGRTLDLSKIEIDGVEGEMLLAVTVKASVPFARVKETNRGLTVSRRLMRVTAQGAELLGPTDTVRVGDTIVSEVSATRLPNAEASLTSRNKASEWLVLRDGIPSVGEPLDNDKTALADAKVFGATSTADTANFLGRIKETLRFPDRVERVVRVVEGDTFTSYSVWRVSYAGSAVIPPAEVFDMYENGVRAATDSQEVTSVGVGR
jgi:hypothetical protein